ncbi:MAG: hypothetical protein ACM3PP_04755 [Candidatus Saccharibacteria bacterium]
MRWILPIVFTLFLGGQISYDLKNARRSKTAEQPGSSTEPVSDTNSDKTVEYITLVHPLGFMKKVPVTR